MTADAIKLTTYGGERHRADGAFAADALLDLYGRHGLRVSVLLRGVEGFGLAHHLRTDRLLTLSEDLPVVSVAVDTRERIEAVLDDVAAIKRHGLVTLERARLLTGDGPADLADETKLTVYVGRRARAAGAPASIAVCELLHRYGLAGATALLGVDGTAHGVRRRASFFGRNADVPVMVIALGAGPAVAAAVAELTQLLERPLVTLERVELCKRDGVLLGRPSAVPGTDEHGLSIWQKLMVHSSDQALHDELVRRLRTSGAAGATTLRGIYGFSGDHPPHGDRLFQLRREVPAVTVVVDAPERIAVAFDVIDDLTRAGGLVTSERVPAMVALGDDGPTRGALHLGHPR